MGHGIPTPVDRFLAGKAERHVAMMVNRQASRISAAKIPQNNKKLMGATAPSQSPTKTAREAHAYQNSQLARELLIGNQVN